MTPRLARVVVVAAAAVAVLVAGLTREDAQTAAREEIVVTYVYSTDASDELLDALVARFNRESHRQGGREIAVRGVERSSGAATDQIGHRGLRPALWTPATSLWGRLLNHRARADWVPETNPSLVYSPQVIAMWEPLARALGWPEKPIGWRDVLELATSPRGWAEHDRNYGPFLLGHSNPDYSTSGLSAVASEYYAVTGKRSGLTLADVSRPDVRADVRAIERSIVHYAYTVDDLTERMDQFGIPYAHAVYAQETNLHKYNEGRRQRHKLVPINPADGTFIADYPVIALDAPWLSAAERTAAVTFQSWLLPRITPALAAKAGFRATRPKGLVELELPEPEVLAAIRAFWHDDRKPANVVLVVDTSSSMGEPGRIDAAQNALLSFLDTLSHEDRVALLTSGEATAQVRLAAPASSRLEGSVRGLIVSGEAPVYPAITHALRGLRALSQTDRINAIVVLSDVAGTSSGRDQLLREIRAVHPTEGTRVRIFTVAYGSEADAAALKAIARASGGEFFPGGPSSIASVYREISANF